MNLYRFFIPLVLLLLPFGRKRAICDHHRPLGQLTKGGSCGVWELELTTPVILEQHKACYLESKTYWVGHASYLMFFFTRMLFHVVLSMNKVREAWALEPLPATGGFVPGRKEAVAEDLAGHGKRCSQAFLRCFTLDVYLQQQDLKTHRVWCESTKDLCMNILSWADGTESSYTYRSCIWFYDCAIQWFR